MQAVAALEVKPVHVSAYSLIIEEGTAFYRERPVLPDEETERELYKITCDFLEREGYQRYEISNYAMPGFACRHNQVYWKGGIMPGLALAPLPWWKMYVFQMGGIWRLIWSADR